MDQNLTQNVDTLFTNMENFAQKEGLIGKAVTQGDKTILPVLSVTLGYGGGDTQNKPQQGGTSNAGTPTKMGGAVGLGAKISTDALIVIDKGILTVTPVNSTGNMSQVVDKIPQILSSMNVGGQQGGQQKPPTQG